MKTAATRSMTVVLNLAEEGHKLEPPVGYHKTRVVLLDAPVETSGPDGRALVQPSLGDAIVLGH